jgi:hypothetical protein
MTSNRQKRMYFNQPDSVSHDFGPESEQVKEVLKFLDSLVGYLIDELKKRNLFDRMNVNISILEAIKIDSEMERFDEISDPFQLI